MTKLRSATALGLMLVAAATATHAQSKPPDGPKLVLLIAVDQFRYDYLPRFRNQYTGGLKLLLDRGASFFNAHLEHYPTVTAVGHSTMLSGATPATSGIIGNDWFDRESGKQVTSVSDESVKLLGGEADFGSSPHRLLVSTVGDEMKRSGRYASRVIGISLKDRSAILPVGRMADAAYWYSETTGEFVSSSYYFPQLPEWVRKFNDEKVPDSFAGRTWLPAAKGQSKRRVAAEAGPALYSSIYASPLGNDLVELFAERAIGAEKLGQQDGVDLLSVSFSSNDAIGHAVGPDAPETQEITLQTDRQIGKLLRYVDETVGLARTIVVLTSDHGVAPVPEVLAQQHMPGGRIKGGFFEPVEKALEDQLGPGKWMLSTAGSSPYLNYDLMREKKLDPAEVRRLAASAIAAAPHVARVYTRDQLLNGRDAADAFDLRVFRSFNSRRSGDLEILLEPYWIRGSIGATHGTPYNYDSHIPLVFMGPSIQPGRYYQAVSLNDLAPTLAAMLDVEIPSGSVGRILHEMFKP